MRISATSPRSRSAWAGCSRLCAICRRISQMESVSRGRKPRPCCWRPRPGEQHTFGLVMLGEFFRREGWHVAGGPATSASDAVAHCRGTWVDVVGFSIGSAARLEGLAQGIRAVRRASCNPNLYVMVGGPLFLQLGRISWHELGADAAAADAAGAVRQANGLVGEWERR